MRLSMEMFKQKNRSPLDQQLERSFPLLIFFYIKKYFLQICLAVLSLFILHWLQIQVPQLIFELENLSTRSSMSILIFKFLVIALGIIVFRTLSRWYFFYPARLQQQDLRDEFIKRLSKTEPLAWKHYSTGKLFELFITDLEELRVFFGFALLQIANLVVSLIVVVPAMMNVSTVLMWSLLPLGFCFTLFSLTLTLTTIFSEKGRHEHDILQQMLIEFYDAKRTLNVFAKERSAAVEFSKQSSRELRYFFIANIIRSITRPLILLGGGLSTIYAAYLVQEHGLSLSTLIVYSTFIFLLYEPLGYLSWMGVILTETKVSWGRIKNLTECLSKPFVSRDPTVSWSQDYCHLEIADQQMNQKYSFSKGDKYVFFGPTAIGKSYYFERLHASALNSNVRSVLVSQEPYLFDQTLRDNLFLYKNATEEELSRARLLLKVFELDDLAQSHEDLLMLHVGEKGKKLSGGQVKRLHMVRSLLFDYELLLWDDPFSAVDVISEKNILKRLFSTESEFLKGKVLILSTHRYSTVKNFSKAMLCTKEKIIFGSLDSQEFVERVSLFFKINKSEDKSIPVKGKGL
jgi:ATP-binding cassette subfamily B multidrug efflux pump